MFSIEERRILRVCYKGHKVSTKRRNLGRLTKPEYIQKIIEAGIQPSQIGRHIGSYQLCRHDDVGDYTMESCRFDTMANNIKDKIKNGGTRRAAEKLSILFKGRTFSDDFANVKRKVIQYKLRSPNGVIHTGENIDKFSRENHLTSQQVHNVVSGKRKSHKGWTLA